MFDKKSKKNFIYVKKSTRSNMSEVNFMHLVKPAVTAPGASSVNAPCNIKVYSSALFQILEIVSKQVLSSNKRIIGTLLGVRSDDGLEFEIRGAFMVPCSETGDSIAIEEHTHKTLYQLYKKAHPKEYVLGWFGSSSVIDDTTSLIHDFYSKGTDRAFPFPAIYLNVEYLDRATQQLTFPKISTYIGGTIGKPPASASAPKGWKIGSQNGSYIFTPIPNQVIQGSATEKLALNTLREDSIPTNTVSLERDLSFLSAQLQAVSKNIDGLFKYIETSTNSDEDLDLLRLLSNNLLNKPSIMNDLNNLEKHFRNHEQDIIMIEYLTKAVKEQIELSARLTASAEADRRN